MIPVILSLYGMCLVTLWGHRTAAGGIILNYSAHYPFILYGLFLGCFCNTLFRIYRMTLKGADLSFLGQALFFLTFPILLPVVVLFSKDDDTEKGGATIPLIALYGFAFLILTMSMMTKPLYFDYTIMRSGHVVAQDHFPCRGTFMFNLSAADDSYLTIDADVCRNLMIKTTKAVSVPKSFMHRDGRDFVETEQFYDIGKEAHFSRGDLDVTVKWPY